MPRLFWICAVMISTLCLYGQTGTIEGYVFAGDQAIPFANVALENGSVGDVTDSLGYFSISNLNFGSKTILVSSVGYRTFRKKIALDSLSPEVELSVALEELSTTLSEVVVSGTKRPVLKSDSPVPVEVYTAKFFLANPTPSFFEAMETVNGVRPQINCNVCNTGDIHINGLEGPYTMVLIDGMPIVSGLSTVYGLTGIPQSLVDRVEVVKGPASTLYGSEAIGGLVNVITKHPNSADRFSLDAFGSSWAEFNVDAGIKITSKHANSLIGLNYFNYQRPFDKNRDGFTDITLQDRFSVFNTWNFQRKKDRIFRLAGRFLHENRWGGEMNWTPQFRGGDEIYGESVYTDRWELFGSYQLPSSEHLLLEFSTNGHYQNSAYGTTSFIAKQEIGFGQLTWQKELAPKHNLLLGAAYRYTYYDDNTVATQNASSQIHLPGLFVQDEFNLTPQLRALVGLRYDYNNIHRHIFTPRLNLKWQSSNGESVVRLSAGSGFRVANVFTEDHAALSGARVVEFRNDLLPEKSNNVNLNIVRKFYLPSNVFVGVDASAFYTHFTNRIVPDYESDQNKIYYDNLNGQAESKGLSLNIDFAFPGGLQGRAGATLMDVEITEDNRKYRQLLTEHFSGSWSIGYKFRNVGINVDYTGSLYSPMRLPLLGSLDNRSPTSPWFSLQNLQLSKQFNRFEIYGGVKNLLNFVPPANSIARAFDPFDDHVVFDQNGQVIPTPENPQALTFDPSYVFASNQGRRIFMGFRFSVN